MEGEKRNSGKEAPKNPTAGEASKQWRARMSPHNGLKEKLIERFYLTVITDYHPKEKTDPKWVFKFSARNLKPKVKYPSLRPEILGYSDKRIRFLLRATIGGTRYYSHIYCPAPLAGEYKLVAKIERSGWTGRYWFGAQLGNRLFAWAYLQRSDKTSGAHRSEHRETPEED